MEETSPPNWCVSMARRKYSAPTCSACASAAVDAALFTRLAMSAGDMPAVMRASAAVSALPSFATLPM